MPAGIRREFSQRRKQIFDAAEQKVAEREARVGPLSEPAREALLAKYTSGPGGQYLALATRDRKQFGGERVWSKEIKARAAEHGYTRELQRAAVENGRERLAATRVPSAEDTAQALRELGDRLAGPAGLIENANVFDEREVLQELAAHATQGETVAEIRAQGRRFAERGDVLRTSAGGLTTAELVAVERRLVSAALAGAGSDTAVLDPVALEQALAAGERPLTAEQARALRHVASSGNAVDVIEALAGTGKTHTAGALREVYENAGYHVIGMAPTGRAVRELAEEAGIPSWTMHRALGDMERHGDTFTPRTVVILDEAGMAPTRLTEQLLAAARVSQAKMIPIGDSGQLASVQAGGWMRELADQLGAQRLTEVMRQGDPEERRALGALHQGIPESYVRWAKSHERVTVHRGDDAHEAALEEWRAAVNEHGVKQAVLIARRQEPRRS